MADRTRQRILLTGAAGTIGSALRASLRRDGRTIRAFDVAPLAEAAPGIAAEELRQGDMRSMEDVRRAVAGCDAVVHLAGIPREAPFEEILATNIGGLQHLLEACRQEGCRRVVFASSNHAIGFYPVGEPVRMDQPPRPDTYYGFSKATGELLARLYFDRFGIESCSIRIGTFGDRPTSGRLLRTLVTPRDLSQLVNRCLEVPSLGCLVVAGVSANRDRWWLDDAAARLGYEPEDDAWDHAAEVGSTTVDEDYMGGYFVPAELGKRMD